MRAVLVVVSLAALAEPAWADPCAEARAALKKNDLLRAGIHAGSCDEVARDVEQSAEKRGWSPVEIVTDPEGGTVVVDGAPEMPFATPRKLWMPPGTHEITAMVDGRPAVTVTVFLKDGNRALARLDLPAEAGPATDGAVDFGEEGGVDLEQGPPPDQEFDSLLPERYLRGVNAEGQGHRSTGRGRPLRIGAGGVAVIGDAAVWGAIAEVAYRFSAGSPRWSIVPALGGVATAETFSGIGSVTVQGSFGPASAGLGPSLTAGEASGGGVALVAGVGHRMVALDARVDLPVLGSIDPSVAVLAGLRW